jgi:hypothetical protein
MAARAFSFTLLVGSRMIGEETSRSNELAVGIFREQSARRLGCSGALIARNRCEDAEGGLRQMPTSVAPIARSPFEVIASAAALGASDGQESQARRIG